VGAGGGAGGGPNWATRVTGKTRTKGSLPNFFSGERANNQALAGLSKKKKTQKKKTPPKLGPAPRPVRKKFWMVGFPGGGGKRCSRGKSAGRFCPVVKYVPFPAQGYSKPVFCGNCGGFVVFFFFRQTKIETWPGAEGGGGGGLG